MTIYRFTGAVCGDDYHSLLDYAFTKCAFASLVVRRRSDLGVTATRLLGDLSEHIENVKEQSEWPGTKLMSATAEVYCIRLSAEVVNRLKAEANCLHNWIVPDLPEDLALLREDQTPWLASIGHEHDAWLKLNDDEAATLRADSPSWTMLLAGLNGASP